MSGLLSGLKFVGKKKEARGEDVADAGGAAAPAAAAARASMDWMSAGGPIDFTGERRRQREEEERSRDPAVVAAREKEEAEKRKLQEEIDQGIRDASGMKFGLTQMKQPGAESDISLATDRAGQLVGDQGASWRQRALKRAKEEAARTGRKLQEVVKERWGSLEELAKGLDNPPSYRCGGGGGGGGGGGSRSSSSRGWKRPAYSRREEEEGGGRQRQRRLEEEEEGGWRYLLQGGLGRGEERGEKERKARVALGREQTDKGVISRFSAKLGEALGRIDPKDLKDGGEEWQRKPPSSSSSSSRHRHTTRRSRSRSRSRSHGREDKEREKGRKERGRSRSRSAEEGKEKREAVVGAEKESSTAAGAAVGVVVGEGGEGVEGYDEQEEARMLALVTGEAAKEAKAAEEAEVKARAMARGRAMAEATAAKAAAKAAAAKAGPAAGAGGKGAAKLPVGSAGAGVDRSVVEGAAGQGEGAGEMKKALPDANKLAAQALKAKLKGDAAGYARLMKEAEAARAQAQAAKEAVAAAAARQQAEEEEPTAAAPAAPVVIHAMDREGRPIVVGARPAEERGEDVRRRRTGKLKTNERWEGGAGADYLSLEELVRREKMGGDDMDREFARNVVRMGKHFKGAELRTGDLAGMDEEEAIDTRMFERREDRLTDKARQQRQQQAAVREHKKWEEAQNRCGLCMDNPHFRKHLMVALGEHTLLLHRTPTGAGSGNGVAALVPQHVAIVPVKHAEALTAMDEEVAGEVGKFKQALRKMFAANGKSVLFLETVTSTGNRRQHTAIECVPVPRSVALDAPLYFKQGLLEADEQWATHKKLIETKGRSIRGAVPKNFPYFHVEWGPGEGYAHVIEDREQFPRDFGLGVMAGMLGVDPPRFDRKGQPRSDPGQEREAVKEFLQLFRPFDWTAELDGGQYM